MPATNKPPGLYITKRDLDKLPGDDKRAAIGQAIRNEYGVDFEWPTGSGGARPGSGRPKGAKTRRKKAAKNRPKNLPI